MKKINYVVIATAIFFTAFTSSCKKADVQPNDMYTASNSKNPGGTTSNVVQITSAGFSPRVLEIIAGNTVTWINDDASVQTATADDDSFNTGDIQPGQSVSVTITAVGQHPYHSRYNDTYAGSVNVAGIK